MTCSREMLANAHIRLEYVSQIFSSSLVQLRSGRLVYRGIPVQSFLEIAGPH